MDTQGRVLGLSIRRNEYPINWEANDYVCKGMNGGVLTIIPPQVDEIFRAVILGNTCLYGATGGNYLL